MTTMGRVSPIESLDSTQSAQQLNTNTIDIKKLFDYNRFDQRLDIILFLMYSPIGLCLFIIRSFIGLHALLIASLLPKKSSIRCFILRTMCSVLGIIVKEKNASIDVKSKTRVIISNHITNFDHLAVDLVLPCIVPGVWDLPKFLNWGLGFHDFGVKEGRERLIENVKMHLNSINSPIPILSYPEGATTNGRVGLLKFSSWLFTLDSPMQPIYITVSRPAPIRIAVSLLGSRWWSDLFWFLFVPFTVFTIRYLPIVKKSENESPDDYASRVQTLMASAMGVCATNHTDADKVELAKRLAHRTVQRSNDNQRSSATNTVPNTSVSTAIRSRGSIQLDEMTRKVKEVLPQVPLNVIQKDIKVTTNIDETITRLLDGSVVYVAEPLSAPKERTASAESSQRTEATNSYISTESMKPFYCGSKTFGKNANERTSSYKQRKEALLETARLRYLERRGSKTEDNNK